MMLTLCNMGVEQIIIDCRETYILLNPKETKTINCNSSEVFIKICHIKNDKFNALWYIMNEIFTLEQMRTVLVVDGEYSISCLCDNPTVKIKSYEYVFERNTSYQTFIFSTIGCSVERKNLEVQSKQKIMKKAKILYLFGGDKTLFPLTGVALTASLIKLTLYDAPTWFIFMTVGLAICFVLYFLKYIYALKKLKTFMNSKNILNYLLSSRHEYRKFTDDLVQKNLDLNTDEDVYW